MVAACALALVAGCLRATVTRCDNGAICPAGQACTEQASLCGPETRVEACAGKSELDGCDPNGTCHAGICDPCTDELAGCYAATWRPMTSGTAKTLRGVWVMNQSDAYAVGDDGVALHYDGFAWSHIPDLETLTTASPLIGIWGSTDELFVLAGNRKVFHFASGAWMQQSLASVRPLAAIGGTAANDVYAAGLLGELWHYDGTAWSSITSGSTSEVYAGVWGSAASDVYLAGNDGGAGIVRHYDGSAWSKVHTVANNPLVAVWGSSAADVYAIGAPDTATPLAHFTTAWSDVTTSVNGIALWGSGPDDVFAAGTSGIYHYDGQAWDDRGMNNMPINAIAGSARSNVIAVGPNGSIWRLARP
jgi:hypothetical protein